MTFSRILLLLAFLGAFPAFSQNKKPVISGRVLNENDKPLLNVTVSILGKEKGTTTNDSGQFTIQVASGKPLALVFSHTGYKTVQRNFNLLEGEQEKITVSLLPLTT